MRNRIVLFILSFIIWALLRYPLDWQHTALGLIVASLVALIAGDLFTRRPALFLEPQRYFWFLGYIFVFIWEWLKANINIAAKLIQPTLDIEPAIIEIKTSLKTDIALTILANTLTLTLGTITLDVDAKNKCLYLHCIESQNAKALDAHSLAVFKRFERIIAKIFE